MGSRAILILPRPHQANQAKRGGIRVEYPFFLALAAHQHARQSACIADFADVRAVVAAAVWH